MKILSSVTGPLSFQTFDFISKYIFVYSTEERTEGYTSLEFTLLGDPLNLQKIAKS